MIYIDINVFLEVALKREHAVLCRDLLKSLPATGGITTDFALYTLILTLIRKNVDSRRIGLVLEKIRSIESLSVYHPSPQDQQKALVAMENNWTFDDALVLAVMESQRIRKIASLDRDFDDVAGIENVLRPDKITRPGKDT